MTGTCELLVGAATGPDTPPMRRLAAASGVTDSAGWSAVEEALEAIAPDRDRRGNRRTWR